MQIIRPTGSVPFQKTAVALGNFDGLHVAHMAIIKKCHSYAREHDLKCGVLLFNEHTRRITDNQRVPLITSETEKLALLSNEDMDFVYMLDFDRDFMQLTPEQFVKRLIDMLHCAAVCVGYDYRFGYKASGDARMLKALCKKHGIEAIITDEIDIDGEAVKSTAIRNYIREGSVRHAAAMLGRPFAIDGKVVKGLQNGRRMGFPTANVSYSQNMLIPRNGVYAGYTYVKGKRYKSVINVGKNPTFDADKITIESHILDFKDDIYNEQIRVEFIERLRGDKKFESVDALVSQIKRDAQTAGKELK
ncbi:MAG: bifunctional riboflavin kinase/FAD synthetase [Clostridiales bacterium]|nr:bifunctional riboflavin kinase/FAD synthetase [Clostridiales bacterium]